MANNASATVDLQILISVIHNQAQNIAAFQQQLQGLLGQLQGSQGGGAEEQVENLNTELGKVPGATAAGAAGILTLEKAMGQLARGVKLLVGGFLAFQSVQFVKGLADAAARSQVLATVLHVVATNAGYTKKEIDDVWMKVQRLGISSDAAAQSLTQMMQANINVEFAPALARAAQDLAVIEGSDSSATFERLIGAIQRLNTLSLRRMGIVVSLSQAEAEYRAMHREITGDLNARHRSEALLLEVLFKAEGLQGTYEAAMGDVAKQVGSLKRLFGDLREELGKQLLPAYSAIVSELSLFLKQMTLLIRAGNEHLSWADRLGEAVRVVARRFFEAVKFLYEHRLAIQALMVVYAAYWAVVTAQKVWDHSIVVVETLTKSIWGTVNAIRAATTATIAWAAANGLLGAAAAARAAGAGVQLALPFAEGPLGKAAAGAGAATFLTTMRTFVTTAGPRLVQLLGQIGPLLWSAAAATTAWLISLGPIVGSIVALSVIFGGFLVFLYNFTSVGETMQRTWGHIKDLFGELGRQVGNTVNLAFSAFNKTVEASGSAVSFLATQLKALGIILEALPGKPLTQVDRMFQGLNIALEFYKIQLAINAAAWESMAAANPVADQAKVDRLVAVRADIQAMLREVQDAETAIQTAASTKGVVRGSEAAKPLEARWKAAGDALKALQAEEDKLKKSLSPEGVTRADQQAAFNKQKAEQAAIFEAYSNAEAKLGRVVIDGKSVSRDFAEANGQVQATIEGYELLQKQIADAKAGKPLTFGADKPTDKDIQALQEQAQTAYRGMFTAIAEAGPKVTDTVARDMLFKQIARVIGEAGPEEKRMLAGLGTSVGIQIARYINPAVQAAEAARASAFKDAEAVEAARFDRRLELTRIANEKQEREDTAAMERMEMTQGEFDLRRLGRKQAETDRELAAGQNRIDSLRRQLEQGIVRGPEVSSVRAELVKAEMEQEVLRAKKIEEMLGLSEQQQAAARNVARGIELDVAQQIAAYGTLDQVLEAINLKYEKAKRELKGADLRAAEIQKDKETLDAYLTALDRKRAVEGELARQRGVVIEAEKQMLALARERVELDQAAGRLTTHEAMKLKNALLLLDMAVAEKELDEKRTLLASRRMELAEKTQRIVEFMGSKAGGENAADSLATRARLAQELGTLPADIDALVLSIEAGSIAIDRMREKTLNYSRDLQAHFVDGFADALTTMVTDFKNAGEAMVNLSKSIANEIVSIFMHAFVERLFLKIGLFKFVDSIMNSIFGSGGGGGGAAGAVGKAAGVVFAEGGLVDGPGTGTSDSIPAMLSAGEHVMPAAKVAQWLPVLEAIRTGRLGMAMGGLVQSVAFGSVIPRRYAGGGVVMTDGGAAAVTPGGMGGNMMIQLHPEALNMTMRDWLEHEVVRQHSRR